ncbi:MAG TPA: CPBP family intramembrane glutamic endopeptidase [Longimicrobiales bacterium]|nr:CPBP family intramembrane glutamic endopeptidase [Longimicrobiales bacterium]
MRSDAGWRTLFVRGGQLRGLWRLLLFAVLFVALLQVGGWLVPAPRAWGRKGAIAWQGALMLLAAVAAGAALLPTEGRTVADLGFRWRRHTARELVVGLGIGAGAIVVAVLLLVVLGQVGYGAEAGSAGGYVKALATGFAVLALPAAAEEAVFRGYPLQTLARAVGPVTAAVMMSAGFAAAHAGNPQVEPLALVNIFLAGVMLSMAYLWSGSLWFTTAVHLGWNWTMALPLDLPVSGLRMFDAPLYQPVVRPDWLTGGAFGPEGGLAGTLGFLLAFWAVRRATRAVREVPETAGPRPDSTRRESHE